MSGPAGRVGLLWRRALGSPALTCPGRGARPGSHPRPDPWPGHPICGALSCWHDTRGALPSRLALGGGRGGVAPSCGLSSQELSLLVEHSPHSGCGFVSRRRGVHGRPLGQPRVQRCSPWAWGQGGRDTAPPEPCVFGPERAVPLPQLSHLVFCSYCSQMLSKEVDACVTDLLKELVRFQDRMYQKDPVKAKTKRRLVLGLREVLKHLKLRKLKCIIISPNCEKIQAKGEEPDSVVPHGSAAGRGMLRVGGGGYPPGDLLCAAGPVRSARAAASLL